MVGGAEAAHARREGAAHSGGGRGQHTRAQGGRSTPGRSSYAGCGGQREGTPTRRGCGLWRLQEHTRHASSRARRQPLARRGAQQEAGGSDVNCPRGCYPGRQKTRLKTRCTRSTEKRMRAMAALHRVHPQKPTSACSDSAARPSCEHAGAARGPRDTLCPLSRQSRCASPPRVRRLECVRWWQRSSTTACAPASARTPASVMC
mmetsp:Transcript_18384/g.46737  ORF Transcript_18384/g.46737 Transcript_18384/m.46737 type:complete len:204 (+) Transcript_18384:78-689(+)